LLPSPDYPGFDTPGEDKTRGAWQDGFYHAPTPAFAACEVFLGRRIDA
jgi:hypothetical protein